MSTNSTRLRRPRGVPRVANPVVISFYLLGGSVPALSLLLLTIREQWDFDFYFGATGWIFAVGCSFGVFIVLLNFGHVQAVALFRYLGFALAGATVLLTLFTALMLAAGDLPHADHTACVVALVFSGGMLIAGAVLVRGLLKVRWLDPTSEPSEWEPQPLRE